MAQTIFSVVVSHEAEVQNNYLFTDKEKALAKVEEIKSSWEKIEDVEIHKYKEVEDRPTCFGTQYKTKIGYWYENEGMGYNNLEEYGSVDLIECVLE